MKSNLIMGATIEFAGEGDDSNKTFMVKGKSMNTGYIPNKNVILPHSEADNIVNSLKTGVDGYGAYILKDHGYKGGLFSPKSVDLVVGRITDANKSDKDVLYEGRIEDEDMKRKIKSKLLSSSSIGLHIGKMNCSICGRSLGDEECYHRFGKEYPEEGLHDIAKDYLEEMGGIPKAAIVASDLRALEQSIVLFPAIEGANIKQEGENMLIAFSEELESLIDKIESKKEETYDEFDFNYDEILNQLRKITEGFNKERNDDISDNTMSSDEINFEKLMGELTDLKANAKLLEAEKTKLETEKLALGNTIKDKDTEIANLSDEIESLKTEKKTLKELNDKYKADEMARSEAEKTSLIETLKGMRTEKGLAEKDYSDTTLETLKVEFEILSEFKEDSGLRGSAGSISDPATEAEKKLEAKEDLREMIFRSRKDQKDLKGIKRERDLKVRV